MANNLCPVVFLGSGGGVYYYDGFINCDTTHPAQGSDTRAHTTAKCPNCPDPLIAGAFPRTLLESGVPLHIAAGEGLKRPFYHRGVPNPDNPSSRPDEFHPGPEIMILAEYSVEYDGPQKRRHQARVVTLAVAQAPGRIVGLGWELDPKSPPPSTPTAHLSRQWIKSVHAVPGGHMIEVNQIGWFFITTVGDQTGAGKRTAR